MRIDLPRQFCAQTVADLEAAASHIERVGWHQGHFFQPWPGSIESLEHVPCCAMGAIGYVARLWRLTEDGSHPTTVGEHRFDSERAEAARRDEAAEAVLQVYLSRQNEEHGGISSVPDWNDEHARTAEEVVAGLRGAAEFCIDVQQSKTTLTEQERAMFT